MKTFEQWLEAISAYSSTGNTAPNPTWMTPDKTDQFQQTYANKPKVALHNLKSWWNQAVDRKFIQSFTLIHYGYAERLDEEIQTLRKQEISAIAVQGPPYQNRFSGNCGIMIKGWITLAGNHDLQTNQWSSKSSRGERRKQSEYYKGFITGQHDYKPFNNKTSYNEFLVSNWKPVAVINSSRQESEVMSAEQLAQKWKLPLIDEMGKDLNNLNV